MGGRAHDARDISRVPDQPAGSPRGAHWVVARAGDGRMVLGALSPSPRLGRHRDSIARVDGDVHGGGWVSAARLSNAARDLHPTSGHRRTAFLASALAWHPTHPADGD